MASVGGGANATSTLQRWARQADQRGNGMKIIWTWLRLVSLALAVLLLAPSHGMPHAVPRTSQPEANAVLHEAPQEIAIRFSERVEARVSSLQMFDAHGVSIDAATASVAPGDPWLYRLTLPPIGAGVYTVSWRVMSADDGHVTEGAYVFVLGGTGISPPAMESQVVAVTGWVDALVRWMGMMGIVVMMGLLTAPLVFWRKQLPGLPAPSLALPWLVVLLLSGAVALFAGLQRLPSKSSLWAGLGILMSSSMGQVTAAKVGIVLLLVGIVGVSRRVSGGRTWPWWLALMLTICLLMGHALVSHAAATGIGRGLAVGAELAHLLGVALWVGGLGYFATLFWWTTFREPSPAAELAWAIPAFSLLATGAVGLLTVSGLYLARIHLDSVAQLLSTPYGRILLAKLGVVALMIVLGAYHQFIVHPRMVASCEPSGHRTNDSGQRFRKTLRIEALLGVLALLLAAFLGTTSPSSSAPSRVVPGFQHVYAAADAQVAIEVWPLRPGPNTIRLTVTGHDGQAQTNATAALVQLRADGADAAPIGFTLDRESTGVFVKNDLALGMEGRWIGHVIVQRQEAYDLSIPFELALTRQSEPQPAPPSSPANHKLVRWGYVGMAGVTILLLLISQRRLSGVIRGIDARKQSLLAHPDRRSHDAR